MTAQMVEYAFGIYFLVTSITVETGKIKLDMVKFIAAVILFILAFFVVMRVK